MEMVKLHIKIRMARLIALHPCRRYAKVDKYKSTWNLDIREYYEVSSAPSRVCMYVSFVLKSTNLCSSE